MLNPHLRQAAHNPCHSASEAACVEPSHIHIPRPSRLARAVLGQPASEIEPPVVVQLDLAAEQAA